MKTQEQERAKFALDKIKKMQQEGPGDKKELVSYASAFPFMIRTNGLGQAAAFFKMKKGNHEKLYTVLSAWLCKEKKLFPGKTDLLDGITNGSMHEYMAAQAEAMAFFSWVKKFAKAFFADNDNNKEGE